MSPNNIVYLDQNYLSNMAKARLGFSMDEGDSRFWQKLFDDLKVAVLADKIACPESEFHRQEASLDSRIVESVGRIIGELSWGLRFNPYKAILESQIGEAAYRFLGKNPPLIETWSKAFHPDPFVPSKETIDQERRVKRAFADEAWESLDRYSKNPLNWPELLDQSKKGVVDGFMLKGARQLMVQQLLDGSLASQLKAREKIEELENLWSRLQSIGIDTNDPKVVKEFLESRELLDRPFICINGSIWAVIAECYIQGRNRGELKSDFYDAPILATVLPYCDIVTTDAFMKEILVKRFQFDDEYGCKVFSASKTDRTAFQKLIKELR